MENFRYYVVWQRRGNFSLDDEVIELQVPIDTSDGIFTAKSAIGESGGLNHKDVLLVNWKHID